MTYYVTAGNTVKIVSEDQLKVSGKLPVGTYTVCHDEMSGAWWLQRIEDYTFEGKVYGNVDKMTQRIHDTFADRGKATGVMLAGEQGSGKTLQAKLLSIEGYKRGISTITVNEPWFGEGFNTFMQSIDDEAIVFFDEFEKVYDKEDQERVLTLLDGAYPSRKMYVITCNDTYRINQHMQNRPGRIYYRLDYTGLEESFIREYAVENLQDQEQLEDLVKVSSFFAEFNFDMLKATVEEMNRYGESALDVMKVINAKPQDSNDSSYEFKLTVDGKEVSEGDLYEPEWRGNPLTEDVSIMFKPEGKGTGRGDWDRVRFSLRDMNRHENGVFYFTNRKGQSLALQKAKPVTYSLSEYMV